MKYVPFALIALLGTSVAPHAADVSAMLNNRLLTVAKPNGKTATIQLKPEGIAYVAGPGKKEHYGKWQLQGDQLCVDVPPRKQVCLTSAGELMAKGSALMSTPNGEKLQASLH